VSPWKEGSRALGSGRSRPKGSIAAQRWPNLRYDSIRLATAVWARSSTTFASGAIPAGAPLTLATGAGATSGEARARSKPSKNRPMSAETDAGSFFQREYCSSRYRAFQPLTEAIVGFGASLIELFRGTLRMPLVAPGPPPAWGTDTANPAADRPRNQRLQRLIVDSRESIGRCRPRAARNRPRPGFGSSSARRALARLWPSGGARPMKGTGQGPRRTHSRWSDSICA